MSAIRLHDTVQFFPFDPIRKEIHVRNAPVEGTVVEVLARHYRVRLAYNASCLVLKTNPSLAKCGPEAAPHLHDTGEPIDHHMRRSSGGTLKCGG